MTLKLSTLKPLAEQATPGPWENIGTMVSSYEDDTGYTVHSMNHISESDPKIWKIMYRKYCEDAEFIAALNPQTALKLIEIAEATLLYHVSVQENVEENAKRLTKALRGVEL